MKCKYCGESPCDRHCLVKELQAKVKDWEESHEQIKSHVKEQGEGLEAKDKQITTLQAEVQTSMDNEKDWRDKAIKTIAERNKLQAKIDELELMQSGYDATIAGYEQREFKLQTKIEELEAEVKIKEACICTCEKRIQELEATIEEQARVIDVLAEECVDLRPMSWPNQTGVIKWAEDKAKENE